MFSLNLVARFLAIGATMAAAAPNSGLVPKGFATTKGAQFQVDGKPFAFVGANSYWLPLLNTQADVDKTFRDMSAAGIKILRTWGFNAINQTELAYAKSIGLTYYQVWNGPEWTLNEGPQGLQRLDKVIATAAKYDIKIILAFTNNWIGYGGMELYVNWIAGTNKTHDEFYTNPKIVASYQRYVRTIVNRYKNSPTIFAWELMNEARCSGDILPSGPTCKPTAMLPKWYKDQAAFVKKLDPYHLLTTGGEGHINQTEPVQYWYNGQLVNDTNFNGQVGEDFEADLALDDIDFGTYHIYPQYWYGNLDFPGSNYSIKSWGLGWIQAHADAAKRVGKPLVLEEFGVSGMSNKTSIYPAWVQRALDTRHGGIMPWQFGQLGLTENGGDKAFKYADFLLDGASPNDGFAIYKNESIWNIFADAAKVQNGRSH